MWTDQLYRVNRSEFHEWLFGPEKFSGFLRKGPQAFHRRYLSSAKKDCENFKSQCKSNPFSAQLNIMNTVYNGKCHMPRFSCHQGEQPRRRRQQKPNKFAYLTMKNRIFARFARAFFSFWHFEDVLVLSTTSNDLFCSCVDDVNIGWQMFNFVVLCPKRWLQFNSRIVRTHFSNIMTLNNWKMIAETRSYIFRWRSSFRCRRVCLSSLLWPRRRHWKLHRGHMGNEHLF